MAKTKKKPTSNRPVIIAAIVLAGLLVLIGLIIWLCRPGPLDSLAQAAEKTFLAESFTVDYSFTVNGKPVQGNLKAAIDVPNRKLEMYMLFDVDKTDYDGGITGNYFAYRNSVFDKVYAVDITDRLDQFFDLLELGKAPDWSLLLDFSQVDLYQTLSEDFAFDTFLTCLGQWLDNMNDPGWAAEHAGYVKEREGSVTTYRYTPDPYALVLQTAPMFQKAFLDQARYEALLQYIDDAQFLFSGGATDFSFSTKSGRLTQADFHLKFFTADISGSFTFRDIGKTTVNTELVSSYIFDVIG